MPNQTASVPSQMFMSLEPAANQRREPAGPSKPFLKWAGAKTKVCRHLRRLMPPGDYRLVEPFVGSGAVFINSPYGSALIADANPDLMSLYTILKAKPSAFVDACQELFRDDTNSASTYYEMREEFNRCQDPVRRAILFVYLNRHCFNGLCRFNSKGQFNTPFGKYTRPYFPRTEMLAFAEKLSTAELQLNDFRETFASTKSCDVIYCDPPYVPLSTGGFTEYSTGGFSIGDQRELATLASQAAEREAIVIISNHDTPQTRELFGSAHFIIPILVARNISCDADNRQSARELIAVYVGESHPARSLLESQVQLLRNELAQGEPARELLTTI